MIDEGKIISAIMETGVSPLGKETGAGLVEEWMNNFYEQDSRREIRAVECGFHIWLDKKTLIIGVQDVVFKDDTGYYGGEWKTTKEGSRYWNEDKWLKDITNGPQLATYALALNRGVFYEADRPVTYHFSEPSPRIMVRAAVKSTPVDFWPSDQNDGLLSFPPQVLESVVSAYTNMAEEIRALRRTGRTPWQLTGKQCFNFNRECVFLETCASHTHPIGATEIFDLSDPAAALALAHVEEDVKKDRDFVVLSSSSYQLAAECKEKYRQISGALGEKESSTALDVGTAFHAGVASFYKQLKEEQQGE